MNKNKFIRQIPRLLGILVIFDLIQALCIGSIWYINDSRARNAMSARLSIEPSWKQLEEYIETQFEVGMTRDDVLEKADEIGYADLTYYFIGEMYCEVYSFRVGPFMSARGGLWSICYGEGGKVSKIERVLSQ